MGNKSSIISIEGNIGSGKSTLLAKLKEKYKNDNIIFLREPVDLWEKICDSNGETMLQKFYNDQEKEAFAFQMMAYISRLALLKEAVEQNPGTLIITERSLYTDKYVFAKMLYDTGKITEVHYQIYSRWFDTFAADYKIDGIIYVQTNPEICSERITRRCRTGEASIPLVYLKECDNYHDDMMRSTNLSYNNILTLNGNEDIRQNPDQMDKWLYKIDTFINKSNYISSFANSGSKNQPRFY